MPRGLHRGIRASQDRELFGAGLLASPASLGRKEKGMPEQAGVLQRTTKPGGVKLVSFNEMFEDVKQITDAIARRAYEIFESHGKNFGHEWDDWFEAERELLHPVHLELSESADSLILNAEVPGFRPGDLELSVEPRRVTIAGHREVGKEKRAGQALFSERCSDQILRIVDLPAEVNPEKVAASFTDGVLEVTMPKAVGGRKIRVEERVA
jgi:HSP20 family protein